MKCGKNCGRTSKSKLICSICDRLPVSDLCDECRLSPTLFYALMVPVTPYIDHDNN